ncbi:carbohydrate-binding domain-containing protein [Fibrobacter sp. UWB11]|uniref:carbohydrate-binding domain-containing protein n=1 Tax=Fibrobacter sp. UWB11 TaxID=1896202 RepID=UPI00092B842A|nr:carbohydrate-binding domain-containing protein [Fibrobacter sp. UWB11]SIO41801.1 protein of unknown function [Fibrobacter sp. UWB11]
MNLARMFGKVRILLTFLVALVCTSMAWAATPVSYIDKNGKTQTITQYTVLTGNETDLTNGWYVVIGDINFSTTIQIHEDIQIILTDGSSMNVGTNESPINGCGICIDKSATITLLTIYGQSGQTGKLNVYTEGSGNYPINSDHLIINSGSVSVNSNSDWGVFVRFDMVVNGGSFSSIAKRRGIVTYYDFIINGGEVSAVGGESGIFSYRSATINGGSISATATETEYAYGGIYANKNITLGYTDRFTRINASSYGGSVVIKEDQIFKDENGNHYTGNLTDEGVNAIAGKTLVPVIPVKYIDENGSEQTIEDYTVLTGNEKRLTSGWYVVIGNVNFSTAVEPSKDVQIILTDGSSMNVGTLENSVDGIALSGYMDTDLKIYGQKNQTGTLGIYASGGWRSVYIGNLAVYGGSLIVNGNNSGGIEVYNDVVVDGGSVSVTATKESTYGIYAKSVTIKSGNVDVTNTGKLGDCFYAKTFTLDGGSVNLIASGANGTGITISEGSITINGGSLNVNEDSDEGGYGFHVTEGSIVINSGVVTIFSKNKMGIYASGDFVINGGSLSSNSFDGIMIRGKMIVNGGEFFTTGDYDAGLIVDCDAEINGGHFTAKGKYLGIYVLSGSVSLGYTDDSDRIFISRMSFGPNAVAIKVKDGQILTDGKGHFYKGTLSSEQINSIEDAELRIPSPVKYVDENGDEQAVYEIAQLTGDEKELAEGWYLASGDIDYKRSVKMSGDVNIILADGSSMNIGSTEDFHYGNGLDGKGASNLTIYGQENQTGVLGIFAAGTSDTAISVENLTMNGGTISSFGKYGIYAKKDITINKGFVSVDGRNRGIFSADGNLVVNSGSLEAKTSAGFYGVYVKKDVIVNSGNVIVSGQNKGIYSKEGSFILKGGSVTASCGKGYSIDVANDIVINSDVTTIGGIYSGKLTINSGVVAVAAEETGSYGIASDKSIKVNGGSITITANSCGMSAGDSLIINNGSIAASVTSESGMSGSYVSINGGEITTTSLSALFSIVINGGAVTATGDNGFETLLAGPVTLGYSSHADHITANKYSDVIKHAPIPVKIKDGQILTDGDGNLYFGTLTDEQIDAIAGKTLAPTTHPLIVSVDGEGHKHAYFEGDFMGSEPVNITEDTYVDAIDFVRTFTAGAYATIVFPFDVNTDQLGGVQKVSRCDGFVLQDNGRWALRIKRLWTDESTTPIELSANTPYMVMMKDETLVVKGGVTLRKSKEPVSAVGNTSWEFRGTLAYQKWEEGNGDLGHVYGFAGQAMSGIKVGEFVKVGADAYISPLRAYLYKAPEASTVKSNYAGAKATSSIGLPDEIDIIEDEGDGDEKTTVIGRINTRTGELKTLQTYDLKGRRVNGVRKARGAYYGKRK